MVFLVFTWNDYWILFDKRFIANKIKPGDEPGFVLRNKLLLNIIFEQESVKEFLYKAFFIFR